MADRDQRASLEIDQFIAHPPSRVWRALTEPALLAKWWAEGDIAPVVGHRFTLDMGKWGLVPCKVTEIDPERRLVFEFGEDWILTWTLSAEDGGTRVRLVHDGFDLNDEKQRMAFKNMGSGWRSYILPKLARVLDL